MFYFCQPLRFCNRDSFPHRTGQHQQIHFFSTPMVVRVVVVVIFVLGSTVNEGLRSDQNVNERQRDGSLAVPKVWLMNFWYGNVIGTCARTPDGQTINLLKYFLSLEFYVKGQNPFSSFTYDFVTRNQLISISMFGWSDWNRPEHPVTTITDRLHNDIPSGSEYGTISKFCKQR